MGCAAADGLPGQHHQLKRPEREDPAMTKLSQGLIDRAVDQWRPRLQAVVKAKGGHSEQLFEFYRASASCC